MIQPFLEKKYLCIFLEKLFENLHRNFPVFDEKNDRYALMQTGWNLGKRVRGNLIYITIENNQIQIEYDGIEQGITQDISAQGIPLTQIIDLFQIRSPLNFATIEPVI